MSYTDPGQGMTPKDELVGRQDLSSKYMLIGLRHKIPIVRRFGSKSVKKDFSSKDILIKDFALQRFWMTCAFKDTLVVESIAQKISVVRRFGQSQVQSFWSESSTCLLLDPVN